MARGSGKGTPYHSLMGVHATHTIEAWEEHIAKLVTQEALDLYGPHYCRNQIEFAEAEIQKLLPEKSSYVAVVAVPG